MWYKLNDNYDVTPCSIEQTFNKSLFSDTIGPYLISTVFLTLDHGYGSLSENSNYKPILFETMVFTNDEEDEYNNYQIRYYTYEQARLGHKTLVRAFRKRIEKIK